MNGKWTFSSNCSLPLRLCQGIPVAALLCCARLILRSVWVVHGLQVMCGMRGCVVCLLVHSCSWESRVAFTVLKGRQLHSHFCAREGRDFLKGTVCCGAAVIEKGFSKAGAQSTTQEVFTAAFEPVAYPLHHHEFCPLAFQGFPYPEVQLIIPQELSDTAAVTTRPLVSDWIPCKHHGMEGCEPSPVWVIVHC